MATTTDPAFEIAEIAERLIKGSNSSGERFLADQFGVAMWTNEFVLILSCIYQRIDLVGRIVQQREEVDEEIKATAVSVLNGFRAGFNGDSFRQHWNTGSGGLIAMKDNAKPLKLLSSVVRPVVSYPKLTDDEIVEFMELSEVYLNEVRKIEDEPEFVRQAIIDGLTKFRFQLQYLGWMGSGYLLESFRELMFVYGWATQRMPEPHQLDSSAVLKGLWTFLTKFKKTVDTAESWRKSGVALFEAYKSANAFLGPAVTLMLTHQGGS